MRLKPLLACMLLLQSILGSQAQSDSQRLTVFAATSLTDVFEALRDSFVAANPDVEILLNFSSSSTLAAQLMQGAPADIFASANELQMDLVVEQGLVASDTFDIFARNQLVLIAPAANPAAIESLSDLADEGLLLVLAAPATPIRAYTDAMLTSYSDELGADFFARVMDNLVSEESNVRQVVARIALGEADAGIVYQSDAIAAAEHQLQPIAIAAQHNQLAAYPIAPLSASGNLPLAARFIEFVLSDSAQPLFAEYGFCSPAILSDVPPADATPEPALDAEDNAETPYAACPEPELISR